MKTTIPELEQKLTQLFNDLIIIFNLTGCQRAFELAKTIYTENFGTEQEFWELINKLFDS